MHMLIAFAVIAALSFYPIALVVGLAHSFGDPSRSNGNRVLALSFGFALIFGFIGALALGGIWALLVPLFGG